MDKVKKDAGGGSELAGEKDGEVSHGAAPQDEEYDEEYEDGRDSMGRPDPEEGDPRAARDRKSA